MPDKHALNKSSAQANVICVLQREFAYLENHVTLALDQQGFCWISIPSACKALGLNARGQQQRIARTEDLALASQQILLSTRGGAQRITCLQVQHLSAWLETLAKAQPELIATFTQTVSTAVEALKKEVLPASYQLLLPFDEQMAASETQDIIAATLPGLGQILVVPSHAEDRAVREAALARQGDWREEPYLGLPYYLASNQMRVYIGDPGFPLEQEEARAALRRMRESTVLTARYMLGRWNIAREQGLLAQEGSVPVRIEEILEWRGLQKHSRAIYPGSDIRRVEGYEIKYRTQAHEDIKLLSQLYLRGTHHVLVEGQWRPITIDGFYMRTGHLQNPENDRELYYVAPGVWINTYEHSGLWLAELDRRIFQLHPQRDQIALRIALFLSEYWQLHFMMGHYDVTPLSIGELLGQSMVAIDHNNLTGRFIPRVERALRRLLANGIVGEIKPEREVARDCAQWGKEWLAIRWRLNPPAEMLTRQIQRFRHTIGAPPMLLPAPNQTTFEEGENHLHTPSERRKPTDVSIKQKRGEKSLRQRSVDRGGPLE